MEKSKIKDKIIYGKKITMDFIYTIVATVLLTAILQVVVYPYFAAKFSSEAYGKLLTIMGIANIFTVAIGGALNNAHLIQLNFYDKDEASGDFNLLLLLGSGMGTLVWAILLWLLFDIRGISFFFLLGYVCIGIFENYLIVAYRIIINYKANLWYNIFSSIGYLIGAFIGVKSNNWCIAFLGGELVGLVYLLKTTTLYKAKPKQSGLLKKTTQVYLALLATTAIIHIVNYLDRFLLYPILGGEQVTIYTVSSFVGKSIGLLVTPIAGVLLSYYAQKSFIMTLKRYWMINLFTLALGIICAGGVIVAGPWITKILYPTVAGNAEHYLFMANMSSLVSALANILMPSILKYANVLWQVVIQSVYALLYMLCGYIAIEKRGLLGFCIATLTVNVLRMALLLMIGHFSISKGERKNVRKD